MQTYRNLAISGILAITMSHLPPRLSAQSPEASIPAAESAPPLFSNTSNKHLRLCQMLGLTVGRTYEFRLTANDGVHYWTVRHLGADGWILARDANSNSTWVNLSQVVAITPLRFPITSAERPKKPNREP